MPTYCPTASTCLVIIGVAELLLLPSVFFITQQRILCVQDDASQSLYKELAVSLTTQDCFEWLQNKPFLRSHCAGTTRRQPLLPRRLSNANLSWNQKGIRSVANIAFDHLRALQCMLQYFLWHLNDSWVSAPYSEPHQQEIAGLTGSNLLVLFTIFAQECGIA